MDLGFVFTNFNNAEFTHRAVESLMSGNGRHSVHVCIVDNASEAKDMSALRATQQAFPAAEFIYNSVNVGYFEGLNVGIRHLRATRPNLAFMVVGNNDLVFPGEFCDQVEANRDRFKEYPIVAPNIITINGVHQNPHVLGDVGAVREFLWDLYYSNFYLARFMLLVARFTRRFTERTDYKSHGTAQPIRQGYGACYILGPLFFEHFSELWAPTFLMHEEHFLAGQLAKKGYRQFYEPGIVVRHHDHASIDKVPSRKLWEYGRTAHGLYRQMERGTRSLDSHASVNRP